MADIVLAVRHGQRRDSVDPDWEASADRIHDPGLTELGRWAAWRVGRRFAQSDDSIDSVYASPFLRTVETADEICQEIGAEMLLEPGLGEYRNDAWFDSEPALLSAEQLAERFDTVRLGHDSYVVPTFPESHAEALGRIGETVRHITDDTDGTVLLVGHGITIGGIVYGLVGAADAAEAPLCGVTRLQRAGGDWSLVFSGDTTHL